MNLLASIVAKIHMRMAGLTGSVTLHFKDGVVQTLEYRMFEKPEKEAA